jgi:hypothetical protein
LNQPEYGRAAHICKKSRVFSSNVGAFSTLFSYEAGVFAVILAVTFCCHTDRQKGPTGATIQLWRNAFNLYQPDHQHHQNEV